MGRTVCAVVVVVGEGRDGRVMPRIEGHFSGRSKGRKRCVTEGGNNALVRARGAEGAAARILGRIAGARGSLEIFIVLNAEVLDKGVGAAEAVTV